MAKLTGLEPAASGVTGRRPNQLSYNSLYHQKKRGDLSCVTGSTSGATGMKGSGGALQGRQGHRQVARPNQLSYNSNLWCLGAVSNRRHPDFQSGALPAELPRRDIFPWGPDPSPTCRGQGFAVRQRPALDGPSGTPGKTSILMVGVAGFEPTTFRPPGGRATRLRHTPKQVLATKWSG